ncbi:unnamed protein product [Onchocerca ochengi]|uniref:Reverse transcriptase domain-containing protein n=1 Tax=Onchocerca ochengi TaxID=42157 RepID=A0A182DZX8_ONCOC|nr:unnamed protein product [Onchocerca ochengi]
MFQNWSGRVQNHLKNTRLTWNICGANEDETGSGNGNIYEDADELKRRLLPTLSAAYEQKGHVAVWRMPIEISQSRLAGRYTPSNACTIIAVKLTEYIYREGIMLRPTQISSASRRNSDTPHLTPLRFRKWPSKIFVEFEKTQPIIRCSAQLLNAFINAIIEGNEIHEEQMTKRRLFCSCNDRCTETFTIPQALEGCGNVFREIEYVTARGKMIHKLKTFLLTPIESDFLKDHLQIYMILIVFERSVLLVYERECNAIFLLDTHTHMKKKNIKTGGLIAMCSVNDLDFLIKWMCKNIFPETNYKLNYDQSFEVSVIAFKGQLQEDDHPLFVPRMIKTPRVFPRQTFQ